MRHLLLLVLLAATAAQGDWPQWRGPQHNGVGQGQELPLKWSATENVAWKTPLPAWSGSTPVVWGQRIFLTSPAASGQPLQAPPPPGQRRRGKGMDPGGAELLLLCLDRSTGEVLWQRQLDQGNALHRKHNNTSPSPVTNGLGVWAVTGTGVVSAFDMEGELLWQSDLQEQYGPFGLMWGYASSPLLHKGLLIVEVLHGKKTDEPSYVVAFEAATGAVKWRHIRATDAPGESPDAYTTPVVLKHQGQEHIVVLGGDYITGHDPASGREVWRAGGLNPQREQNYRIVGSPLVAGGMVYAPTRKTPLLAFKAAAQGGLQQVWSWQGEGAPDVPSPVSDGRHFYMVDDRGRATCLDAKTGVRIWGPERTQQGNVSASPILADGKLYIVNEYGVTTVLAAGPTFEILAVNTLDGDYTLASPALAGDRLLLRTASHLYCIGPPNN